MRTLKGLIRLQIALIVLCVAVYAVAWLRVQPLIAARQQLLQEIRTQQQQRDELLKQIAALQEQKNSLNESVTALVEKINSLQGTGRQVQELKSEAVKAWEKYPPKQAWCYQERDPRKPSERQYSVHCHWSQDRCSTAKAGSEMTTSCGLVPNLDRSLAALGKGVHGFMVSA